MAAGRNWALFHDIIHIHVLWKMPKVGGQYSEEQCGWTILQRHYASVSTLETIRSAFAVWPCFVGVQFALMQMTTYASINAFVKFSLRNSYLGSNRASMWGGERVDERLREFNWGITIRITCCEGLTILVAGTIKQHKIHIWEFIIWSVLSRSRSTMRQFSGGRV